MSLAINARLLRASMLEVAGQRHVSWARLRGLNKQQTERRHILRNASLPIVTALGMHIGELIGGTLIIESIFAWPGIGRYAVSAISRLSGDPMFHLNDGCSLCVMQSAG